MADDRPRTIEIEPSTDPHPLEPSPPMAHPGLPMAAWLALFAASFAWVAWRMRVFHVWVTVIVPDGSRARIPNGFATVDHPFHATRAELLRRALADGRLLRWIGSHQGGYPVEFYPLGAAAVDVAVWLLALGRVPMPAVHAIVVVAVLFLPGLAYAAICRADRMSLATAAIALAGQIAVRGWWWSGGGRELIEWGLVSNVLASSLCLFAIPTGVGAFRRRSWRSSGLLAVVAAACLLTNTRTAIALGAVGLGVLLAWATMRHRPATGWRQSVTAVVLAAAIAAPLLVSLGRYSHLYVFVRYSGYASLRQYLDSSVQAVGLPLFLLGLIGLALVFVLENGDAIRAAAWTLIVYVSITAWLVVGAWPSALIEQLETTRLMPFQRYLWLLMAGYGVVACVRAVTHGARRSRMVVDLAAAAVGLAIVLAYVVTPVGAVPESDRGLVRPVSRAAPAIVDLERAVRATDAAAAPGTSLLVLGSTVSWHDQLWSPLWSDRHFYYDDWLWYWQTRQAGDYDPLREHAYRRDASALEASYLKTHGIGGVIVTGEARQAASSSPLLERIVSGPVYDAYRVVAPTTMATIDGRNQTVDVMSDDAIDITTDALGGVLRVRANWFPRWTATVDGETAPIRQTPDGYMEVAVPPGASSVHLGYGVDWIDWFSRLVAVFGVLAAALLVGWGDRSTASRPNLQSGRR